MYQKKREELADICHLLYQRNLVYASDGNVSMRVSEEHILLTPSGKNKGFVTPNEILVLDFGGRTVYGKGRASKEYPMHRIVYENRKDAGAVIHTHPVYATAFALAGMNLPENYLIEMPMMLHKTALAGYATPGTEEMAQAIQPYIQEHNAVLLKNHGVLAIGRDLMDGFNKIEVMESVAKTIIMSKVLGEPQPIPEDGMSRMRK